MVKRITDLIKSDSYTITQIAGLVGIDRSTYYIWLDTRPEFKEAVEKAEDARYETFAAEAEKSMLKLITGYTVEETKITTIPGKKDEHGRTQPKIKEQTVIKKHVQPNTAALIFTLTNRRKEKWQNKQYNELTGKDGKDLIPEAKPMSRKEAAAMLKDLIDGKIKKEDE